jgi:beta-lactamase regulating signal transducer with metallopeptidase domain
MTGWLVAWLWQGMALALGISAAFKLLPRVNASTRYVIWWCAFAVLVWLGWSTSPYTGGSTIVAADPVGSPPALLEVEAFPQWIITSTFALWAAVACFKLVRILPGLKALYRLKDACDPVLREVEAQLPLWREAKKRGRPVQLMICNELPNAAVLGLQQPYVAVPFRLLEMVSAQEPDQILLHEYGHVQRRDDWTRLAQAVLEAALWIHPAARWIGHALNLEREVACDDWVISTTRAARAYAGCLSRVAENSQASAGAALVPALFGRTPDVLRRVDRLLNPNRNATRKLSVAAAGVGICMIVTSAAHLRAFPLVGEMRQSFAMPKAPAFIRSGLQTLRHPEAPVVTHTAAPVIATIRTPPSAANSVTIPTQDLTIAPPLVEQPMAAALVPSEAPSILNARSFHSVYVPSPVSARPEQKPVDGWQLGVTIGRATRKASVAVAGSVAKASVSIAKSF